MAAGGQHRACLGTGGLAGECGSHNRSSNLVLLFAAGLGREKVREGADGNSPSKNTFSQTLSHSQPLLTQPILTGFFRAPLSHVSLLWSLLWANSVATPLLFLCPSTASYPQPIHQKFVQVPYSLMASFLCLSWLWVHSFTIIYWILTGRDDKC